MRQKTIICGSCGSTLILAIHTLALPVHAYIDVPNHSATIERAIAIAERNHLDFVIADSSDELNINDFDHSLVIVGFGSKDKKPKKKEPIQILTLSAILTDRIDFEIRETEPLKGMLKPKNKSYFKEYGNQTFFKGKLSKRKGGKNNFHIKQPRHRSQYQYRKPVIES